MQQTAQYKLNKPEADDPIAVAPLNENADKIEAALLAEASARASGDAALAARVQSIEAKRMVYGVCSVASEGLTSVTLGFTPCAVLIHYPTNSGGFASLAVTGRKGYNVTIVENGFTVEPGTGYNIRSGDHTYLAFG